MKSGIYIENYKTWPNCEVYYKNNKIYLVETNYNQKIYIKNNKWHKLDGPAFISSNGYREYWIDGKTIYGIYDQEAFENTEEYKEYIRLERLRAFE